MAATAHADERFAEAILVGARRFADDHHRRAGDAVGEHRVLGGALQGAALEGAHGFFQFGDGGGARGGFAGVERELRRFEWHGRAHGRRGEGRPDRRRRGGGRDRRGGRRGDDGRRRRQREAVDRLLADRLVESVIDVPAQQRGGVVRAERRFHQVSCLRKAARIGAHIAASAWLAMWPLSDGIST